VRRLIAAISGPVSRATSSAGTTGHNATCISPDRVGGITGNHRCRAGGNPQRRLTGDRQLNPLGVHLGYRRQLSYGEQAGSGAKIRIDSGADFAHS